MHDLINLRYQSYVTFTTLTLCWIIKHMHLILMLVLRCLGLQNSSSKFKVKEGYTGAGLEFQKIRILWNHPTVSYLWTTSWVYTMMTLLTCKLKTERKFA